MNPIRISVTLLLVLTLTVTAFLSCSKKDPEPEPTGIQILNPPDKTDYFKGDVLNLTGLVIDVSYDNGDNKEIGLSDFEANGIACTPANGTDMEAGMEEVTISHTASGEYILLEIMYMKMTDIEDNIYDVVKIGDQFWMAENLKVTRYSDSSAIPHISNDYEWSNLQTIDYDDAYCYYRNNAAGTEADTYGALYTWLATLGGAGGNTSNFNPSGEQGVCPDGWHLPSAAEWEELEQYLNDNGFPGNEATALKSTYGWEDDNNGTDDFGFTALPSGIRWEDGSFALNGYSAFWWTTTTKHDNILNAMSCGLSYNSDLISVDDAPKTTGFPVRCVKN